MSSSGWWKPRSEGESLPRYDMTHVKTSRDGRSVLLMDEDGVGWDCTIGNSQGPMARTSGSYSGHTCEADCVCDRRRVKRKRSRAPSEPSIGVYGRLLKGEETKYIDHKTQAVEPIVSEPLFIALNAIKTGDQFYEKVGSKVTMMDLEFWYRIQNSNGGNNEGDVIRIMIVYDRSPTAANGKGHFPDKTTLISSFFADGTTSSTSEDNINPTQTGRFLVLKDSKVYMSNDAQGDDELNPAKNTNIDRHAKVADRCLIELNGLMSNYRPHEILDPVEPNPSIRQITMGSLLLVVFGLHAENNGWNFHYTARLRYQDA